MFCLWLCSCGLGLTCAYWIVKRIADWPYSPRSKTIPKDANILITGCDSGFGRMAAIELAKNLGVIVYAGCLTPEAKEELQQMGLPTLFPLILDVTNPVDIEDCTNFINHHSPEGLFGLVNNAGIFEGCLFDWTSVETVKKIFEVNFFGNVAVSKAMVPLLIKRQGRIINIASYGARHSFMGISAYSSSKSAIVNFYNSVRMELAVFGVDVIIIYPGTMKTPLMQTVLASLDQAWSSLSSNKKECYGQNYYQGFRKNILESEKIQGDPLQVVRAIIAGAIHPKPKNEYFVGFDCNLFELLPFIVPWISYLDKNTPAEVQKIK